MWILNTILNILFPVNCISCGKSNEDLCPECINTFPEAERETLPWVSPLYDYRHPPIKKSIWLLKYKSKIRFANVYASLMYDRMLEELAELAMFENFHEAILIPIPLSRKRYKERGYNQAELICKQLVKLDEGNNFKLARNLLIKNKETVQQARIKNRQERLKNLVGSFSVKNPQVIKNQNIILIDDVTTTGATLKEARSVLRKAGARKVIAFTVAH